MSSARHLKSLSATEQGVFRFTNISNRQGGPAGTVNARQVELIWACGVLIPCWEWDGDGLHTCQ